MPNYPQQVYDMIRVSDELLSFRVSFLLKPQFWAGANMPCTLNWQSVKFEAANTALIPTAPRGIYSFVIKPEVADHVAPGYLLYIGMTDKQTLRERYKQYLREPFKRKPRPHIMRMLVKWPDHLHFYYSTIPTSVNALQIEEELIKAFLPPANVQLPVSVREIVGAFL